VFFVRSAESSHCPCCGNSLEASGSRRRVWYRNSGNREKLIIRRLYCERCHKTHHELPDVLIPYKRYGVESIEQVVDNQTVDVPADDSTLWRWYKWFKEWGIYAIGCLISIAKRFSLDLPVEDMSGPPRTVLQKFGHHQTETGGWLSKVVRPIVNVHLWLHTRSAFLSSEH